MSEQQVKPRFKGDKRALRAEQAKANAALKDQTLGSGWFRKTRRSKGKVVKKNVLKQTDDRYFLIKNEKGQVVLTWAKKDDYAGLAKAQQRYLVKNVVCVWTGITDDETGQVSPSFSLRLPKDIGVYPKQDAKAAKQAAKAAKKAAKSKKADAGVDASDALADLGVSMSEPEPEAANVEEAEPPENNTMVELNPMKNDKTGRLLMRFIESMVQNGAMLEGGASTEVTSQARITVLQDGDRSNGFEFTLDDRGNNCLKDFKGSMVTGATKGITVGLRLTTITDPASQQEWSVLGWPTWAVWEKLNDPDTPWPLTVGFQQCSDTIVVEDADGLSRCTGMVAAVTGGSKGIGLALATSLVQEGADVALIAQNEDDLSSAREEIIATCFGSEEQMLFHKRAIRVYSCDAADLSKVDASVDNILEEFDKIDILVNAAAIGQQFQPTFETTIDDFRADFETHFMGNVQTVLNFTRSTLNKAMLPSNSGQVINISCSMGRKDRGKANPMSFGFGYSKFAVETLTTSFANSYASKGIRFNVLVPGRTITTTFPRASEDSQEYQDPAHVKAGLRCLFDTDMNDAVIDCVQENNLGR